MVYSVCISPQGWELLKERLDLFSSMFAIPSCWAMPDTQQALSNYLWNQVSEEMDAHPMPGTNHLGLAIPEQH